MAGYTAFVDLSQPLHLEQTTGINQKIAAVLVNFEP